VSSRDQQAAAKSNTGTVKKANIAAKQRKDSKARLPIFKNHCA